MAMPPPTTYPPANAPQAQTAAPQGWTVVQQGQQGATSLEQLHAATQLHQQQFFSESRKKNRLNGSTPAGTAQNTRAGTPPPNAVQGAASSQQQVGSSLFQPFLSDETVARQLTLGALGADINSEKDLKRVEDTKVATVGDVFRIMRGYHVQVVRPEMVHITNQIEQAFVHLDSRVTYVADNLAWLQADNGKEQRQRASLMVTLQGFPENMSPTHRQYPIRWMLCQVNSLTVHVSMLGLPFSVNDNSIFQVLASEPVTIKIGKTPQGDDKWSSMTMLTFKGFDLRKEFTDTYVGKGNIPLYSDANTAVPGKHLITLFSTPQYQRKLEAPLRVLMRALNNTASYKDHNMVPLWKSLTLMTPRESKDFQEDATACASFCYVHKEGRLTCVIHIVNDVIADLQALTEQTNPDGDYLSVWEAAWNDQIFGPTLQEDMLEDAQKQALMQAATQAKGIRAPKGKGGGKSRHWAQALVHCDSDNPYPVDVEWKPYAANEMIPFNWNEYCMKFKKDDQKVADKIAITLKGKPEARGSDSMET